MDQEANNKQAETLHQWWLHNVSRGALGLVQVPHHLSDIITEEVMDKYRKGTLPPLGVVRLLEFFMFQIHFGNRTDVPDELKEIHDIVKNDESVEFSIPSGFKDRYLVIDKIGLSDKYNPIINEETP